MTEDEFNVFKAHCAGAPEVTAEAQIKEGELGRCDDLAWVLNKVPKDATWDEISAAIVEEFGAEGAPTQQEFETHRELCKEVVNESRKQ